MKKLVLFLFTLLFFIPVFSSDQDNIAATAKITGEITVIGERDLSFGIIPFDDSTTITYNDTEDRSGKFNVLIGPGRPHVLFSFSLPTELDYIGDGDGLEVSNWTYGYGQTGLAPTISGPFPASYDFTINMADFGRNLDFYIGATVTPNPDNLVGEYEGIITLVVENN